MASGRDFFIEFKTEKTAKQLRGFYRICGLLSPYFEESEGTFFDKDMVKEYVKQELNFCTLVKGRVITKSLTKATRKEMKSLIDRLYEVCEFYELKDYELSGDEKKALNEFYNLI